MHDPSTDRELSPDQVVRAQRRAALDQTTHEAAEAGLYDTVPDYSEALRIARQALA